MTEWTPQYPQTLNDVADLKLARYVRPAMNNLQLSGYDLLIIIHNGACAVADQVVTYTLNDGSLPRHTRQMARAAGLDDVLVDVQRSTGKIVAIRRRGRRRQEPLWTPAFRQTVSAGTLRLTGHARARLQQRRLTVADVLAVIRRGRCERKRDQVHYSVVGHALRDAEPALWARLNGVVVVVCPYTTMVITVYRRYDGPGRRPRKGPGRRDGWTPDYQ